MAQTFSEDFSFRIIPFMLYVIFVLVLPTHSTAYASRHLFSNIVKSPFYTVNISVPLGDPFLHVGVTEKPVISCQEARIDQKNACLILLNTSPYSKITVLRSEDCPWIDFQSTPKTGEMERSETPGLHASGFFYSSSPPCPTTGCNISIAWMNLNGTRNVDHITFIVCPAKPPNCPRTLQVNELGAEVRCTIQDIETSGCNPLVPYNISMKLNGPDKDKFIVDNSSQTVFARGDAVFTDPVNTTVFIWNTCVALQARPASVELFYVQTEPSLRPVVIETNQLHYYHDGGEKTRLACSHPFGKSVKHYNWSRTSSLTHGPSVEENFHGQIFTLTPVTTHENKSEDVYYSCEFFDKVGRPHRALPIRFKNLARHYEDAVTLQTNSLYIRTIFDMGVDLWALKLYMDALVRMFSHKYTADGVQMSVYSFDELMSKNDITVLLRGSHQLVGQTLQATLQQHFRQYKWPDCLFDAKNFLSGSVITRDLEENFSRKGSLPIRFLNGSPSMLVFLSDAERNYVSMTCFFASCVEHRRSVSFEWSVNRLPILTGRDSPFHIESKLHPRRKGVLCTVEVKEFKLVHKFFTPDDFGSYTCKMTTAYDHRLLPWTVSQTRFLNRFTPEIYRVVKVRVEIYPSPLFALPETNVTVHCRFYFTDSQRIAINDILVDDIEGDARLVKEINMSGDRNYATAQVEVTAPENDDVTREVSCSGGSDNGWKENKARIQLIRLFDDDHNPLACQGSTDEFGTAWPTTPPDHSVTMVCPAGYSGMVSKTCTQEVVWTSPSYSSCTRDDLMTISKRLTMMATGSLLPTEESVESVSSDLRKAVNSSIPQLPNDLVKTIDMMQDLSNAVSITKQKRGREYVVVNSASLENLASIANGVLSADTKLWEKLSKEEMARKKEDGASDKDTDTMEGVDSGTKLLASMDNLIQSSLNDVHGANKPIVTENIVIKRDRVRKNAEDIRFPEAADGKYYDDYERWALETSSTAVLPAKAFINHTEDVRYAVVLYKRLEKRFSTHEKIARGKGLEGSELASEVLSFSINMDSEQLLSDLQLQFRPSVTVSTESRCAYLDVNEEGGMVWSDEHCRTQILAGGIVRCFCNHLTNFAVLMSPRRVVVHNTIHYQVLSTISLIGCLISIICLILTLITYAVVWKKVKSSRSLLHVLLSTFLLLAYLLFLGGINRTDHKIGCLVITVFLHYFLLVAFSIMLTEGVELYMRVKIVFSRKSLGWKLFAPAFVGPLVIVGITVGATWDKGYTSPNVCWLNIESGAVWSFLGFVIIVVITNTVIVILVFKTMLSTRAMANQERRNKVKTIMKAVCVITPLLGFTWIFGLVAVHKDAIAFQYMFAVCNSLQGLFIFIFHCILAKQVREAVKLRVRVLKSQYLSTHSNSSYNVTTHRTTVKSSAVDNQVELMHQSNQ